MKKQVQCPSCKGTIANPTIVYKGKNLCRPCEGTGKVDSRQGKGARNKGAGFERDIAKQVSAWTGVTFRRTPMSGGWSKTGDITPKDPQDMVEFPFNMELKNQECWTVQNLFNMRNSKKIRGWWKQCKDDAKKSKRVPLLVFTKATIPVFLLVRKKDFDLMGLNSLKVFLVYGKMRVILWDDFIGIPYKKIVGRLK